MNNLHKTKPIQKPENFHEDWGISASNCVYIYDGCSTNGGNYCIEVEIIPLDYQFEKERVFLNISYGSNELVSFQLPMDKIPEIIKMFSGVAYAKQQVQKADKVF